MSTITFCCQLASKNHMITASIAAGKVLEQYDLAAEAETGTAKDPSWQSEGDVIMGYIPGSKRYVAYAAFNQNGIWDVATNKVVRNIKVSE